MHARTRKRCRSGSRLTSSPATRTLPASGRSRPPIRRSIVLFPAPLPPSTTVICRRTKPQESPRKTGRRPKVRWTPSKAMWKSAESDPSTAQRPPMVPAATHSSPRAPPGRAGPRRPSAGAASEARKRPRSEPQASEVHSGPEVPLPTAFATIPATWHGVTGPDGWGGAVGRERRCLGCARGARVRRLAKPGAQRRPPPLLRAGALRVQPARVCAPAPRDLPAPPCGDAQARDLPRHEPGALRHGADGGPLRRGRAGAGLAPDRSPRRPSAARAPEAPRPGLRLLAQRGERRPALGSRRRALRDAGALLPPLLRGEPLPPPLPRGKRAEPHAGQAARGRARPAPRRLPAPPRPARRPAPPRMGRRRRRLRRGPGPRGTPRDPGAYRAHPPPEPGQPARRGGVGAPGGAGTRRTGGVPVMSLRALGIAGAACAFALATSCSPSGSAPGKAAHPGQADPGEVPPLPTPAESGPDYWRRI